MTHWLCLKGVELRRPPPPPCECEETDETEEGDNDRAANRKAHAKIDVGRLIDQMLETKQTSAFAKQKPSQGRQVATR
jgi:hypothetical protein